MNIKDDLTFDLSFTFESFVFIFLRIHWLYFLTFKYLFTKSSRAYIRRYFPRLCWDPVCFKRYLVLPGLNKNVPASHKHNVTFIKNWLCVYFPVYCPVPFFIPPWFSCKQRLNIVSWCKWYIIFKKSWFILNYLYNDQRRIQDLVKHLRWSFSQN